MPPTAARAGLSAPPMIRNAASPAGTDSSNASPAAALRPIARRSVRSTSAPATTPAYGCASACSPFVPNDDADGDGVADTADNCAGVANSDQADLDRDGIGNPCDPLDAAIASAKLTIRAGAAGAAKGRVTLNGTFVATAPSDGFVASEGVTAAVSRANGTTVIATWSVGQCTTRGSRITCVTPDRSASASFRAGKSGIWKYKVTIAGLELASATSPAIAVRVQDGAGLIDRVGHLAICTPPASTVRCAMP